MNSTKSVLIIEDSSDIRCSLVQLLESEGYSTITASDGRERLSKLQEAKFFPHMILLDLMMPVMDGFEFRKHQMANELFSKIPVIVMTADSQISSTSERLFGAGLLKKPLDIDTLLNLIEKLIK